MARATLRSRWLWTLAAAALLVVCGCSRPKRVLPGLAGPGSASPGVIVTVAGNGDDRASGDGGPALEAGLGGIDDIGDIEVSRKGTLYLAAGGGIRTVDRGGTINTVAGSGGSSGALIHAKDIALGSNGDIYFLAEQQVRRVGRRGRVTTVAGDGWRRPIDRSDGVQAMWNPLGRFTGDGGPAAAASLNEPCAIAVGPDDSLYIADTRNGRIRRVGPDGIITTVAGGGTSRRDGVAAIKAAIKPIGVAVGDDGIVYIAESLRVRRTDRKGVITTIAGSGARSGPMGDGGPATRARFKLIRDIAVASDGTIYVVDELDHRVRRIDRKGVITTVAGDGWNRNTLTQHGKRYPRPTGRFRGDGGPATAASLNRPTAIALDARGNLYIADTGNHRIRKVGS